MTSGLITLALLGKFLLVGSGGAAPGDPCNPIIEDTWDNLTGWTQDSNGDYSADATNDELDLAAHGSSERWIYNTTETTNDDHCACWEYKTIPSGADVFAIALRFPTTNANFYAVGRDYEDATCYVSTFTRSSGGASWQGNVTNWSCAAPNNGDEICACVEGTGNGTIWYYWDLGATRTGNCASDWGTPDQTITNNPGGLAVDSGTRVGFFSQDWANPTTGAGSLDNFVGGDY